MSENRVRVGVMRFVACSKVVVVEGELSTTGNDADTALVARSRVCMECEAPLPDSATSPSASLPASPATKPKQEMGVPPPFDDD
jgi:hypothetical protein